METEGLIFQLKAEISAQDAWLKIIVEHDFSKPLVIDIDGYNFIVQKLYSPSGCEPRCPEMRTLPDNATEEEIELYNLEQKMRRTYTAISTTSNKAYVEAVVLYLHTKVESVEYAQYDGRNIVYSHPRSRAQSTPWGIDKIKAKNAWSLSQKGEGVVIAVIDTGVEVQHLDLINNIWEKNGKHGYDFSGCDDIPEPVTDHGTHCSGIIAAEDNNIGVVGVAPKAKIMALKVFPNSIDSVCARAIRYAACNGAKVLNNSWEPATISPFNRTLVEAVDYAYLKRCIVVFAAGNKKDDVKNYSPANYHRVISVAATTKNDVHAKTFSNWGDLVTVAAPGVSIQSTIARRRSFGPETGTSMSCAHVSGVVALMVKAKPTISFEQVKKIIRDKADPVTTLKPIGGRINAFECVKAAKALP